MNFCEKKTWFYNGRSWNFSNFISKFRVYSEKVLNSDILMELISNVKSECPDTVKSDDCYIITIRKFKKLEKIIHMVS